jgi:short subunit dehydrogenase-like uncharacterized protein
VRPVLCGQDGGRIEATASALGLPHRAARVDDSAALAGALDGVSLVVNAAGPFSQTAMKLVESCLEFRVHYLDLCAEVPVLQQLASLHSAARERGLMIMPAVGFDVVPTDSLAAHLAQRVRRGRSLTLAVSRPAFLSPGSAKTLLENADLGVARRGGAIQPFRLGSVERAFDFGAGPRPCLNVSSADIVTAYYTTGVPNITTFVEATPLLRLLPLGLLMAPWLRTPSGSAVARTLADAVWRDPPGGIDPAAVSMQIIAEIEDGGGRRARARLTTPEAYAFTGATAAAIACRVLAGDHEPGFQTPARLFGPDFVLSLGGVSRQDLE